MDRASCTVINSLRSALRRKGREAGHDRDAQRLQGAEGAETTGTATIGAQQATLCRPLVLALLHSFPQIWPHILI